MNRAGALGCALLGIIAACGMAHAAWASDARGAATPPQVDVLELRHGAEALRSTDAAEKRMKLPRLILLDGRGRPVLIEVGMRAAVGNRLARALAADKPLPSPIALDLLLGEVVDAGGKALRTADLPKADAYVVDYWAQWCGPCRELARDVDSPVEALGRQARGLAEDRVGSRQIAQARPGREVHARSPARVQARRLRVAGAVPSHRQSPPRKQT